MSHPGMLKAIAIPVFIFPGADKDGHRSCAFPERMTPRRGDPRPPSARNSQRRLATPAAHHHRAERTEKAQCKVDRHFVGGKVAGDTSLWECCNADTRAEAARVSDPSSSLRPI